MKHRNYSRTQVAIITVALLFVAAGTVAGLVVADGQAFTGSTTVMDRNCDPGTDGCVSSYRCSDGIDNDGDGYVDMADPGCSSSSDDDESPWNPPNSCTSNCGPGGSPAPQCNDKIDNDGDGKIDYPADPGCSAPGDNDEYNAAPPPPPPPPPPTTTSASTDADQDGVPDNVDNCIGGGPYSITTNPDQSDLDLDHIGDVCDPSPIPSNAGVMFTSTSVYDSSVAGPTIYNDCRTACKPVSCPAGARLKTRVKHQEFGYSVFGSWVKVLSWDVEYDACYVPNGAIKWASVSNPRNPSSKAGWQWHTTNDTGYPMVNPLTTQVTFNWQGSAGICVFRYGCGPSKHPWTQIVFYPTNTYGTEATTNGMG